ncbi:type IV pili methyl-accepting chemotaxis transducer N-terminal domain-containing protein [Polaromonas sp. P1(28)-13]|nr:type IV pili methyl-accepting chemotaxis transducer N-terminal domain-containing protein [Polaromonas sp. P1(28)-13]
MLSQRMSKAYLALIQKVETGSAQQVLDRSMSTFDRQLVELKAYAPSPEIRDTYARLESVWSEFKSVLVGTTPGKEHASNLIQLDAKILALSNQGTRQYEQAAGKATLGKLVNIAGRQRMLSQRMAKFYLANSLRVDPAGQHRGNRKVAYRIPGRAGSAAQSARSHHQDQGRAGAGRQPMGLFDMGLSRLEGAHSSPKLMSDVFITSENLLSVMDRITGLYSSIKA